MDNNFPQTGPMGSLIHVSGNTAMQQELSGVVIYPDHVANELCMDAIDPELPEMKALHELHKILNQYRHRPPKSLLEELKRRTEALRAVVMRGVYKRFAGYN